MSTLQIDLLPRPLSISENKCTTAKNLALSVAS